MRHLLDITFGPTQVPDKLRRASQYLKDAALTESVGDDDALICGTMCFCSECIQLRSEVIDVEVEHSESETLPGDTPTEEDLRHQANQARPDIQIGTTVSPQLAEMSSIPIFQAEADDEEFVFDLSIPSPKIGGQKEETKPTEDETKDGKAKGPGRGKGGKEGKGRGKGRSADNKGKPKKAPKLFVNSEERRRLSRKRPASETEPQTQLPTAAGASDGMVLPIKPNFRKDVEVYFLQPSGCPPPRYCGTVTVKECPNYIDVANKLVDELNGGLIVNSKRALKIRKAELISEWA